MPKRKRDDRQSKQDEPKSNEDVISHSVLGGMKGGYRVTGDEERTLTDERPKSFKVALESKAIICERRGGDGQPSLVFTHGAGGGIANSTTKDFADGFAEISRIVLFQGTMNLKSRIRSFHAVIKHENAQCALGGRSMGARAAVINAQVPKLDIKALVLVSFPMVGGKKAESREQILHDLPSGIDVLFITGSSDSMCDMGHLRKVIQKMKARSWLVEVRGADHSMSLKQKGGVEPMRRKTGSLAADWLLDREDSKRYCNLSWSENDKEIVFGGWQGDTGDNSTTSAPAKRPAKKAKTK